MEKKSKLLMSMPPRCVTCNKVIGRFETIFQQKVKEGMTIKDFFDTFNIDRECCRRFFLGYVDILSRQLLYPKGIPKTFESDSDKNG